VITPRSLRMHTARLERYAAREEERRQAEANEAYARRLGVLAALENRQEVQQERGQLRGELNSLLAAQAKQGYGSAAGAGSTAPFPVQSRTIEAQAQDEFVEQWNEWKLEGGHLSASIPHPGRDAVEQYARQRIVEKFLPQLQRAALIKYGFESPYRTGEP
jgi:hypothetical protein